MALALVVYFSVPAVRTCYGPLRWNSGERVVEAYCSEPEFAVSCLSGHRYYQDTYDKEILCRTRSLRLVRIVDNVKRQARICVESRGWLSNYDRDRGCFCDYHSSPGDGGKCVMTDEACRDLFGSGAVAVVDAKLGYADQCGCDPAAAAADCRIPKAETAGI